MSYHAGIWLALERETDAERYDRLEARGLDLLDAGASFTPEWDFLPAIPAPETWEELIAL
jgi:hypothetical protein